VSEESLLLDDTSDARHNPLLIPDQCAHHVSFGFGFRFGDVVKCGMLPISASHEEVQVHSPCEVITKESKSPMSSR